MLVAKVSVAIDVAGEVHVWGLDGVDFQQQVSKHLSVMHQMATLPQVYLVFEEAIHMRFSVRASSLPACPKGLDEYPMAEKSAWLLHEMRQFLIMRLGRRQGERAKVV